VNGVKDDIASVIVNCIRCQDSVEIYHLRSSTDVLGVQCEGRPDFENVDVFALDDLGDRIPHQSIHLNQQTYHRRQGPCHQTLPHSQSLVYVTVALSYARGFVPFQ
jgi:hypothetical protein